MNRAITSIVVLLLTGLLPAGCGMGSAPPTPTRAPAVIRTVAPLATPQPQVTATAAAITDTLTLPWWTPEFLSPKAPAPAGPLLAAQISDFEAARSDRVRVNPVLKARYGKGGLLDFLRTAQPVAPSILPDLVVIDIAELEQVANLAQPLDGLLPADIMTTLYPFARQEGQFDGRTLAIPWIADLEHVIYDRERVSQPPTTWAGVLSQKLTYVFPIGAPQPPSTLAATGAIEDVQPMFIGHYLSAGGAFDTRTRRLILQEQPLVRVLTFYRDAYEAQLLPKNALNIVSPDDAWNAFAQEDMAMANISARRYLANRDALPAVGFAAIPGWSNPAPSVARGWAWVIITADPARQKAAADFIAWMMTPERSGPLAQASGWLPTAPAGLTTWGPSPYFEFLGSLLASAVGPPVGAEYAQTANRLQKAVAAVLRGTTSPTEAAQTAMTGK